jgi:DNA-binding response OmpR family regulator
MARRILVVEDEAPIADAIAARLRSEGFEVRLAADGPSGVAQAEQFQPDLVLLDLSSASRSVPTTT